VAPVRIEGEIVPRIEWMFLQDAGIDPGAFKAVFDGMLALMKSGSSGPCRRTFRFTEGRDSQEVLYELTLTGGPVFRVAFE